MAYLRGGEVRGAVCTGRGDEAIKFAQGPSTSKAGAQDKRSQRTARGSLERGVRLLKHNRSGCVGAHSVKDASQQRRSALPPPCCALHQTFLRVSRSKQSEKKAPHA